MWIAIATRENNGCNTERKDLESIFISKINTELTDWINEMNFNTISLNPAAQDVREVHYCLLLRFLDDSISTIFSPLSNVEYGLFSEGERKKWIVVNYGL